MQELATQLANQFYPYTIQPRNAQREQHLLTLCKMGVRVRGSIYNNEAIWTFSKWKEPHSHLGSIMVFPALFSNSRQVMPSEIIRL
jgi:hypothetical protein